MAKHIETGKKGEIEAINFLKNLGFEILELNWRFQHSEIDIIAKLEGLLVFVEVKTRKNTKFGLPEESVSKAKQKKMIEGAEAFIELNNYKGEIRFDIISILYQNNKPTFYHIKDAFFGLQE